MNGRTQLYLLKESRKRGKYDRRRDKKERIWPVKLVELKNKPDTEGNTGNGGIRLQCSITIIID